MPGSILCDPYVWEAPFILFQTSPVFSTNTVCMSEHVNHVVLVGILGISIGYLTKYLTRDVMPLYVFLALALFFAMPSITAIYRILYVKNRIEEFKDANPVASSTPVKKGSYPALATYPTAQNPFMNIMPDQVRYNPTRPSAASVLDPAVSVSLDDFFKTEFARDPTDVFGRSQSQREFITMPSTSIPNDVDSYQNWLYRIPGKTCKEGGTCLPGTDGAALPWLNRDS